MKPGVPAIVENGAGMKAIDTDQAALLEAMQRKSMPIMGLAKDKTLAIVYCVAQGHAKSPHEAQCVLSLGMLHDHARNQGNFISGLHGMQPYNIQAGYGRAFMEAAADPQQGVLLQRLVARANERNKAHVGDFCRLQFKAFLDQVFANAIEDDKNAAMYPRGSKIQEVHDAESAEKVSQHAPPFCAAVKT
jgi:hypothetical protein